MQGSVSVVMVEADPDHVWLQTSCLSRDDSFEIVDHADTADEAVRAGLDKVKDAATELGRAATSPMLLSCLKQHAHIPASSLH